MTIGTKGKKAEATKRTLLAAALKVMAREGYAEATIGQIAKEAGVSKGLAYYHFKSKSEIATEILETGVNDLVDRFEAVAAEAKSGREALDGMLQVFCDSVVGNWRFARFYLSVIWREGHDWSAKIHDIDTRLIAIIADQFKRGQQEGTISMEVDPEFSAVACIGTVLTTSLRYFGFEDSGQPEMSKEEFVNKISRLVVRAAAADRD